MTLRLIETARFLQNISKSKLALLRAAIWPVGLFISLLEDGSPNKESA
ncbi:MAG TPA: hypothetical protein VKV29_07640 [Chthonomonas sp.]|nr:hypothetical protein [Chthonomonas sp.]HLH80140.1 hypothetical protein [Chthonomonas sp.]